MPTTDELGTQRASLKGKRSIYESTAQRLDHVDPKSIRLQRDRCLIQDIPDADRIGSIWVPEVAKGLEQLRQGIIIAIGPGDNCIETVADQRRTRSDGGVPLRGQSCDHSTGRMPMSVGPGDLVLYNRRDESEIFIDGTTFDLVYEEQSILLRLRHPHESRTTPKPLRDRVLISQDAKPQKTLGGLYIPQNCAQERPEGVVVAVGPGKLRIDGTFAGMEVKPGDNVVFREGGGASIKIKGERFLVMREDDIYGVLG